MENPPAVPPALQANMWQPGQSGNPKGNFDRHSTKPIAKRIQEYLDKGCENIEALKEFKSKAAKDAIIEAMITNAVKGDKGSAKLLFEMVEGKPAQSVDVTTNGEKISQSTERLDEVLAKLKEAGA